MPETKSETNQSKPKTNKRTPVEPAGPAVKAQGGAKSKAKEQPAPAPVPAKPRRSLMKVEPDFPFRYLFAFVCGLLLLMFLCAFFTTDGVILQWVVKVICGLFGKQYYHASILGLVYLIWIQLSSRSRPVRKRSFSVMFLLLFFGCYCHLVTGYTVEASGLGILPELFATGRDGVSGGVICGGICLMMVSGFGRVFTMAVLVLLMFLMLIWASDRKVIDLLSKFHHYAEDRLARFQADRAARREAEEDDGNDPDPNSNSGGGGTYDNNDDDDDFDGWHPVAKFLDNFATNRAAKKANKKKSDVRLDEDAALQDKTRQMVRAEMPELEAKLDGEPLVLPDAMPLVPAGIQPTDPEVRAEVAAEPGAAVTPAPKQKVTAKDTAINAALVEQEIAAAKAAEKPLYSYPPIELLQRPRGRAADGTAEMRENTRRLNETLASFKIDAHISNVTRGPSVTRYEVELEKGVRLNKLTTCADDIALSLGASGVRIAPVPGKISVVGIEVPNQTVTNVSLREVIDSNEFAGARSHSSIAVGKDIGGRCIIGNIAKFPHMLIAGTTGSGKSVCMNSIIISLLYKASPEDVKLIMVDPKMVELGIYNGIPHLLIPVVTDPKKAAGSLQWAVTEMLRRYRSMSDAGVRDLESYNSMIDGGEIEGEKLPQVVVIIDELADLMLVAAKEVEESICRIAQMGRAAGIHLIIATQRPSADVITGLMKANIPSRIAFSVASAMESRIILDTVGAEKLVGRGDMLYSPIGSGKPQRVQGCFVTDAEVEAVASYVKEHFSSTYDQTVMDDIERKAEQTGSKGAPATASDPDPSADELAHDEMLPDAVEVILETKQASVSLLQRRLKLGYARAARIVDEMEELGIVGPFVGSKPRQILITKEQWEQMKQGQTIVTQPAPAAEEDIDIPF